MKNEERLLLTFIGIDSWDRPVYKDQHDCLWKDITLGSSHPAFYSSVNNAFDGEPDLPLREPFSIQNS